MLFDADNEAVLQQMRDSGDDLSQPRVIDFTVVLSWDVVVKKHMLPTNASITAFERELQAVAAPLGGRNDGWGCFEA